MVSQRVKKRRGDDTLEIDVLVVNAGHVVVVEVKASLSVAEGAGVPGRPGAVPGFFPGIRRLAGAWGGSGNPYRRRGGSLRLPAGAICAGPNRRHCEDSQRREFSAQNLVASGRVIVRF